MGVVKLSKSFGWALNGLSHDWKNEQNFRIEVIIGFLVIISSIFLPLQTWEVVVIILLIAMVLIMELINTVLELLVDLVKPRVHKYVSVMKDVMAAAVLVMAIASALVGILIFWPYMLELIEPLNKIIIQFLL